MVPPLKTKPTPNISLDLLPKRAGQTYYTHQVVRYGVDGHYHAHLDSETHEHPEIPCCHQIQGAGMDRERRCKLCRYLAK